ncbi:hypothetical protein U9M48_036094 [Paspalum notatum var. saurae]|uniref:Uncharacterized protein n=1 Tax=Paspalum notatum var. saurae TaxID=547442 RepID=A0AAQ3UCH0_PASNO
MVSLSSAKAEHQAVTFAVAECCWLRQLLQELHVPIASAAVVYCDNFSAVYMTGNPIHHRRTKHIEIDIHFICEKVALGQCFNCFDWVIRWLVAIWSFNCTKEKDVGEQKKKRIKSDTDSVRFSAVSMRNQLDQAANLKGEQVSTSTVFRNIT